MLQLADLQNFVQKHYGLSVEIFPLAGEVDLNYRLKTAEGEQYTLKISSPDTDLAEIEFQQAILEHLKGQILLGQVPRHIPDTAGNKYHSITDEAGKTRYLRLQTWVAGRMLDTVKYRSPQLLIEWGATCGRLNLALKDFDHPQAHRFYKWNPSETLHSRQYLPLFTDEQQVIAGWFWDRFENRVQPQLASLRKTVNYNDAHEMNLLVDDTFPTPRISGVIDFGDTLYTHLINELAIGIAYGSMGLPDPLTAACQMTSGFHGVRPLEEPEIAVLYDLVAARLLITVASAAHNQQAEPDNEYLQVSAAPAWALLQKWREIPPALAHYRFREACGLEPVPQRIAFNDWVASRPEIHPVMPWGDPAPGQPRNITSLRPDPSDHPPLRASAPLRDTLHSLEASAPDQTRNIASLGPMPSDHPPLRASAPLRDTLHSLGASAPDQPRNVASLRPDPSDLPLPTFKTVPLDLSVSSLDLGNNENFLTIRPFTRTINRMLEDAGADFGVGGYGEVRPFYTTDAYQVMGNEGAQWRTVHLGLDVWGPAETPVFAPLAGTVFSAADNAGERDYGPTVILEHKVSEALSFYTLYGHLSRQSVEHLQAGQAVSAGQQIATVGPAPENGNWPPHLHFQIILDLLGESQDFAGVAYPTERGTYLSLCPDPHLLFPGLPQLPDTVLKESVIREIRNQHLGRSLSVSYQRPLHIVRGFGAYLYDTTGRRYLDTVNNVAHVGHEHPRVVRAAQRQQAVLNTNTRYLHENVVLFAEELAATLPEELSVVHFVNSGSEANELALRMAKVWSGQRDMIAVEVGYHGNTGGCIDVSSYKFDGKGGQGAPAHTHIVPSPDTFRGLHREAETAGQLYANYIQEAIGKVQADNRNIAGFIAESILSCGGQIVLPPGYLQHAYQMVRAAGGLCIADEVQVGLGRVGEHFWGFELQGVVPDIVTIGKPIGNGHPLAAVVTTPAVAAAFANGMEYFNTFGGNPVSCAIGREVLKVVQAEGLPENARRVGKYLRQGLLDLQQDFPIVGDVRGPGFFQGIELIRNPETLEPAAAEASYLANRMRERGILMSTDGPLHNVLKIKPPMCFTEGNADFLLENLRVVLRELA